MKTNLAGRPVFEPGDVVVFDPSHFNPDYWNNESEENRIKYYGPLGYGAKKQKLFVYITAINHTLDGVSSHSGHCVLMDMDDGHLEYMRHDADFRLATEDEF